MMTDVPFRVTVAPSPLPAVPASPADALAVAAALLSNPKGAEYASLFRDLMRDEDWLWKANDPAAVRRHLSLGAAVEKLQRGY